MCIAMDCLIFQICPDEAHVKFSHLHPASYHCTLHLRYIENILPFSGPSSFILPIFKNILVFLDVALLFFFLVKPHVHICNVNAWYCYFWIKIILVLWDYITSFELFNTFLVCYIIPYVLVHSVNIFLIILKWLKKIVKMNTILWAVGSVNFWLLV